VVTPVVALSSGDVVRALQFPELRNIKARRDALARQVVDPWS
jgi:hypothetical protein